MNDADENPQAEREAEHKRLGGMLREFGTLVNSVADALDGQLDPDLVARARHLAVEYNWAYDFEGLGWYIVLVQRVGLRQATLIASSMNEALGAVGGLGETLSALFGAVHPSEAFVPDLLDDVALVTQELRAAQIEVCDAEVYSAFAGLTVDKANEELSRMRRETPALLAAAKARCAAWNRERENGQRERD